MKEQPEGKEKSTPVEKQPGSLEVPTTSKNEKSNEDYLITLDLSGKGQQFRDKAGGLKNFWDNAKAMASSIKEKWGSLGKESSILGLSDKAAKQSEQTESEAAALGRQRQELERIAKIAEGLYAAPEGYKPPIGQREKTMVQVADMIQRAGPFVKDGFTDVVEALEHGYVNDSLKPKARGIIQQLLKEHKWQGENLNSLNEVLTSLEQDNKNDLGDPLESFAKRETYSRLAELVALHNPLNMDNKELSAKLNLPEGPDNLTLQNALKAVKALRSMSSTWPKPTLDLLGHAEDYLNKDLKVVSIQKHESPTASRKLNRKSANRPKTERAA